MTIKEIDEQIAKLREERKELENKKIKEFQKKAKSNVGRCFIKNGQYVMIIDVPKETWDRNGYCDFNRYQYPALYLGYDKEETDPLVIPFHYDTIFSDILGETKSTILLKNCKEISKEEFLLEFDRLVYELRDKIKKAISPCCSNCYFFNGEEGDNIQFCDEKQYYVQENGFCRKWMSK